MSTCNNILPPDNDTSKVAPDIPVSSVAYWVEYISVPSCTTDISVVKNSLNESVVDGEGLQRITNILVESDER